MPSIDVADFLEGYVCCPPLDCLFTSHRQRKKKEPSGPLIAHDTSEEDDSGEGFTEAGFSEGEESNMSTLTPRSDESEQDGSGESGAEDEESKLKVAKMHKNQEGIRMHASMLTNLVHLPLIA